MITLRDGRRLDYSGAGPEDGFPVLYFQGAIGVVSSLSPLCAPHALPGMPAHISLALRALAGRPGTSAWLGEHVVALVRRYPWLLARAMTAGAPSCDRRMLAGRDARAAAAGQFLEAASGGVPACMG